MTCKLHNLLTKGGNDMPIQYGLIKKDQVQVFLPLLPEDWQTMNGRGVSAVGAVKNGRACGVLVFRADELTADILHVAVSGSYQRQGIASGLIDFLCKSAWETGTAVLCTFAAAGRDDPLCRLFTKRGDFTLAETEDYICRFPCNELTAVKLNAAPPAGSYIEAFYTLPEDVQYSFFSHLKEDNVEFARGLREEREQMLEPLCLCVVEKGAVQASIFCQNQEGDVLLSFVYARPGGAHALMTLTSRLRELLVKAVGKVSYLHIAAVTPESRKLIDTLLPAREITGRFYTAYWDMNTMGG